MFAPKKDLKVELATILANMLSGYLTDKQTNPYFDKIILWTSKINSRSEDYFNIPTDIYDCVSIITDLDSTIFLGLTEITLEEYQKLFNLLNSYNEIIANRKAAATTKMFEANEMYKILNFMRCYGKDGKTLQQGTKFEINVTGEKQFTIFDGGIITIEVDLTENDNN